MLKTVGSFNCVKVFAAKNTTGLFDMNFITMHKSSVMGWKSIGLVVKIDCRGGCGSVSNWDGVWPKFRI